MKDKELIKKLKEAKERIDNGDYITEEEFFKDSPSGKDTNGK